MCQRCSWAGPDPLSITYHDEEWGVPTHDDRQLFEMLILGGAQAGLSWITILRKRENYREAFDNFDAEKIIQYDDEKLKTLMENPGIVRNRFKIKATVDNARTYLALQEEFGSFDAYVWQFVDGKPIQNSWYSVSALPTRSVESEAMSKDMKKRGLKFVGPTICYAFMQAVGMVNDHIVPCFRHKEIKAMSQD